MKSRRRPVVPVTVAIAAWARAFETEHPNGPTARAYLADELGVSFATASRWVRGLTMPRADDALGIQKLTGVSIESLARARASKHPEHRRTAAKIRRANALLERGRALLAAAKRPARASPPSGAAQQTD